MVFLFRFTFVWCVFSMNAASAKECVEFLESRESISFTYPVIEDGISQIHLKFENFIVGDISYELVDESELKIFLVFINQPFRGKGLSEKAFQEVLRLNPKVTKIHTHLIRDNEDALREALDRGETCVEAMKSTPAYKVRKKLGFSKITQADCFPPDRMKEGALLVVER
jgi:hypothetical protein